MQKANGRVEKRGKPKITKRREISNNYTTSHKKGSFQGHIIIEINEVKGYQWSKDPGKFKPIEKEIGYV